MTLLEELIRCKPWIEAALEYSGGTHNFDDVAAGVMSGQMQLWPAPEGMIVTEIVTYPRKRVLNIFLASGELNQILDFHTNVQDWAENQGCSAFTMSGRRGWVKALKNHGWQESFTTMAKVFI
ncbi:hypothetical protein N9M91_02145 [Porticoccaceae bacterium]|nr:hypothetical protein [Porticoccaceae bacterium]